MIGRAIGEVLGGLSGGAVVALLGKAWGWAEGIFKTLNLGDDLKSKVTEHLFNPKGFKDEFYFAKSIQEISATVPQKQMFAEVMEKLEQEDKLNKTRYASNFRIIVTLKDEEPVPVGGVRPSVTILRDIMVNCKNHAEILACIVAVGSMQDTKKIIEKVLTYGKDVTWPAVEKFLKDGKGAITENANALGDYLIEDTRIFTEEPSVCPNAKISEKVASSATSWLKKFRNYTGV